MIDDNQMEHLMMQRMFDSYQIFPGASHSLDAKLIIDYLTKHAAIEALLPEVIFLDLHMPGFCGQDFLEELEALYPRLKRPITVYVISSTIDPDEIAKAKSYSFVKDFIEKPVKKDRLKQVYFECEQMHQMAG